MIKGKPLSVVVLSPDVWISKEVLTVAPSGPLLLLLLAGGILPEAEASFVGDKLHSGHVYFNPLSNSMKSARNKCPQL